MAKAQKRNKKQIASPVGIMLIDDLPELVTPDEARAVLRISRNCMYELIKGNKIAHIKFGRLIRIRKSALLEGR